MSIHCTIFFNFSVCVKFFRVQHREKKWGNTHHFFLLASKNEDQYIQFYYIFGELSPGISLRKKKRLIYEEKN